MCIRDSSKTRILQIESFVKGENKKIPRCPKKESGGWYSRCLKRLLNHILHDALADGSGNIAEDIAVFVDEESGGEGIDIEVAEQFAGFVHEDRIGVAIFLQERGDPGEMCIRDSFLPFLLFFRLFFLP